jgi:hypothetical protein
MSQLPTTTPPPANVVDSFQGAHVTPSKSSPKRLVLTALAGIGLSLGMVQAPAQAAGWDLNGSGAGVVGAHAFGTADRLANGKVRIVTTIKDTAEDGKLALVKLTFTYNGRSGNRWEESTGSSKTFTVTETDVFDVTAQECVQYRTAAGKLTEHCGANEHRIWPS